MAPETKSHPSFSPYRKWGMGLQLGALVLLVLAVAVMANYLSRDYFLRFYIGSRSRIPLSARTIHYLESITNQVRITAFYNKDEPLYSTVADLLNEYQLANSKISVRSVDYLRDPSAAQKVSADYPDLKLASGSDKNVVIFDCEHRVKVVPNDGLAQFTLEQTPGAKDPYRRKLTAFEGEKMFTAALIAVINPKPLKSYFLTGHGEHQIESGDSLTGYMQFASVLRQNYVQAQELTLTGTNAVPQDCNLLVVAGPTNPLLEEELQKIEKYLAQGGRMLVLMNSSTAGRATGLEKLLTKWGVGVGRHVVVDPEHTASGAEVIVSAFSKHPVVNPLLGSGLYLIRPLAIGKLETAPAADAPQIEEIAFTGPNATLYGNAAVAPRRIPLMVALEKGAVKGVVTERGATRMIVAGDSLFLGNHQLDLLANRDFAGYAANWLLDRTQLLAGLGSRPVNEYRLVMSRPQMQATQAILLAGMPCAVLVIGVIIWFRRRS